MKKTKITRIMMSLVVLSDYNLLKGYGTKL